MEMLIYLLENIATFIGSFFVRFNIIINSVGTPNARAASRIEE